MTDLPRPETILSVYERLHTPILPEEREKVSELRKDRLIAPPRNNELFAGVFTGYFLVSQVGYLRHLRASRAKFLTKTFYFTGFLFGNILVSGNLAKMATQSTLQQAQERYIENEILLMRVKD